MDRDSGSGDLGGMKLEVGLEFHKTIDYDRKAMRGGLKDGANQVIREARRLASRRAISAPGDFPGFRTGTYRRAIGVVSKGSKGGWIKVGLRKTAEMGRYFYPAFLFYSSPKTGLAKRGNVITAALAAKREAVRGTIRVVLKNSLVPR